MALQLDLTDKLTRFPFAYGWQPVKGWPIKHFDTILNQSSQRTKQHALAEGPWDECEKLWVDSFAIPSTDFIFHPGLGNDAPDVNFPSDAPHPWTAYISAKLKAGITEDQMEALFGIYRTLRTGNYNGAGQQLNQAGSIVSPSDPRDEFFFKPNPANAAVDQIIRWGQRSNVIINWPAWVNWRDFNDELINWDDASYTPRALSLTPTTGGSLTPGQTYYIRVSTMKGGDESSASIKTLETKHDSITLIGGQSAFQVNWLIKGDEQTPPVNPTGITGYRVYIGTIAGTWLGYFTVSNPAARNFLVTTTAGVTGGNPLDQATSGLLRQIKRFECGLFLVPPYDLATSLDRICQISCADWQWSGLGTGTFRNDKVLFMSPADRAPVFTLNLAETSIGSFKTYPVDRRSRPNQIIVNFRDRDDEFLGEAQPVILNRDQLQIDDKQIKAFTIDAGTVYRSQAQRISSFYARVLCDMDQMAEMIASPKSYHVLPGDPILVTNNMPGWTDVEFVVRKKGEHIEARIGDSVIAQLYTNGLYSDTDHSPLPRPLPVAKLDPFAAPPPVTSLVLQEINILSPNLSFNTGFQGTFTFGNFHGPQIARVLVKGPSAIEPPDSAYQEFRIVLPDANNQGSFQFRGLAGGRYWVKVVTESSLGSSAPSGHPIVDIQLTVPLPTILKIFDNVPPKDSIQGLGLTIGAVRSTGTGTWLGMQLWRDRGYGYERVAPDIRNEATLGHSTDNGDTWLATTAGHLYFVVEGGIVPNLTNATTFEIGKGKNNLFIGREKIGVQTWTNLGGGIWKGENLVRGLNHTEIFQATHTAQEDVILLDENAIFLPIEHRDIGVILAYKAVTFGLSVTGTTAQNYTPRGDSIRHYAPSPLEIIRDGVGDWTIDVALFPRSHEIPSSLVAELWSSTSRVNPDANRKARLIGLPAVTAPLVPISSSSAKSSRGQISIGGGTAYKVTNTHKNNMRAGAWTSQGAVAPWSRLDFNMHFGSGEGQLGIFNPWANELDGPPNQTTLTGDYFQVYLWYGEPAAPPAFPILRFPLIGIKWSAGILSGTIKENFFKYTAPTIAPGDDKWTVTQTLIATRDHVDPGVGVFRIQDTDPVDTGRPGPRYSFLIASNEIRIYAGVTNQGTIGQKPIAIVPFLPKPTGDATHQLSALSWPFPLHLFSVASTFEASACWCRNMILGGGQLGSHRIIVSAREQVSLFGSLQTTLHLRLAQLGTDSLIGDGFPLDITTPDIP